MATKKDTSSTKESQAEVLLQQAQDGITDIKTMAFACQALIHENQHEHACNLLNQLIEKSEEMIDVMDYVNVARVAKGGAS